LLRGLLRGSRRLLGHGCRLLRGAGGLADLFVGPVQPLPDLIEPTPKLINAPVRLRNAMAHPFSLSLSQPYARCQLIQLHTERSLRLKERLPFLSFLGCLCGLALEVSVQLPQLLFQSDQGTVALFQAFLNPPDPLLDKCPGSFAGPGDGCDLTPHDVYIPLNHAQGNIPLAPHGQRTKDQYSH
jgi:hypothetical protein